MPEGPGIRTAQPDSYWRYIEKHSPILAEARLSNLLVADVLQAVRSIGNLARLSGIHPTVVRNWGERVPKKHLAKVEQAVKEAAIANSHNDFPYWHPHPINLPEWLRERPDDRGR